MNLKKIRYFTKNLIDVLFTPSKWYSDDTKIISKKISMYLIIFLIIGLVLRFHFYFPYFELYICIFGTIEIIVWICIRYYIKQFPEINALLANQRSLQTASFFYYKYIRKNPFYFFVPIITVCVFSWGGCKIYGSIEINPLLIWIMILFTVTVYLSIVGYVQYILLAIFLLRLSLKKNEFSNIRHTTRESIPADIIWVQKITKLVHIYRIAFFFIGSLYIIAFIAFCYLPEFKTEINTPVFFLLWNIIFFAIVLTFPLLTILEYIWIKTIVQKLKTSYILDIETEIKYLKMDSKNKSVSKIQIFFMQNIYTQTIAESREYPIKSLFNVICSTWLAIFNVIAIAVTLIQGIPSVLNDLLRIF